MLITCFQFCVSYDSRLMNGGVRMFGDFLKQLMGKSRSQYFFLNFLFVLNFTNTVNLTTYRFKYWNPCIAINVTIYAEDKISASIGFIDVD